MARHSTKELNSLVIALPGESRQLWLGRQKGLAVQIKRFTNPKNILAMFGRKRALQRVISEGSCEDCPVWGANLFL
jgi:hypothetical protein